MNIAEQNLRNILNISEVRWIANINKLIKVLESHIDYPDIIKLYRKILLTRAKLTKKDKTDPVIHDRHLDQLIMWVVKCSETAIEKNKICHIQKYIDSDISLLDLDKLLNEEEETPIKEEAKVINTICIVCNAGNVNKIDEYYSCDTCFAMW